MALALEAAFDAVMDDEALVALFDSYAARIGAKGYAAGWSGGFAVDEIMVFRNDWSDAMLGEYHERYAANDPWTRAMLASGEGADAEFLLTSDYVSDHEFGDSALYNDLLRANGDDSFRAAALVGPMQGGLCGITFYRGRRQSDFDRARVMTLNEDAEALGRVLALKALLAGRSAQAASWRMLVDRFAGAVFVLTVNGRLLETNRAGERMLERRAPFFASRGAFFASHPATQARLADALLRASIGIEATPLVIAASPGGRSERFHVLAAPNPGGGRRIVLMGEPPARIGEAARALLIAAFALSPAEAAVMARLAEGASAPELAQERGVSVETVRTQYRAATAKMGCEGLGEALSRVRRIVAISGAES
ncbi:helix-turn-helix transcriptional regulator [Aurantiacibacter spongiae]|nr:LuxR C-terminal-related transcriptional regulator [Aurantiacibacter spongiae]